MRNAEHLQQLNSMLFGFQSNSDEDSQALKQVFFCFHCAFRLLSKRAVFFYTVETRFDKTVGA